MRWAATQQRTEQCHTITSLFLAVMQYSNRFAIQQKLYFVVQHCRGLATFLYLVSWCFEPSQPQRISSGLNTNLLYLQVIHFTSHFITSHAFFFFLAYFYSVSTQHGNLHPTGWPILFCGPTQEPVLATTNTGKIGRGFGKNAGEWTGKLEVSKEEIPGSKHSMDGYILTYSRL